MELSQRAKQLSILLLEQPAGCPLTLAELSEQMHLSKRTIQRALPEVRDWMKARNCLMQSRAGSGIFLESSEKAKCDLLLELQGNAHGQESLSQQAELLELLQNGCCPSNKSASGCSVPEMPWRSSCHGCGIGWHGIKSRCMYKPVWAYILKAQRKIGGARASNTLRRFTQMQ